MFTCVGEGGKLRKSDLLRCQVNFIDIRALSCQAIKFAKTNKPEHSKTIIFLQPLPGFHLCNTHISWNFYPFGPTIVDFTKQSNIMSDTISMTTSESSHAMPSGGYPFSEFPSPSKTSNSSRPYHGRKPSDVWQIFKKVRDFKYPVNM